MNAQTPSYEGFEQSTEPRPSVRRYVNRGSDQVRDMVRQQPTQSLFVSCAIGFVIGIVLGRLIGRSEPAKRGYFDRASAERWGQQFLKRVEQSMPEAIRERLSS